jgi:hypothetical protein
MYGSSFSSAAVDVSLVPDVALLVDPVVFPVDVMFPVEDVSLLPTIVCDIVLLSDAALSDIMPDDVMFDVDDMLLESALVSVSVDPGTS